MKKTVSIFLVGLLFCMALVGLVACDPPSAALGDYKNTDHGMISVFEVNATAKTAKAKLVNVTVEQYKLDGKNMESVSVTILSSNGSKTNFECKIDGNTIPGVIDTSKGTITVGGVTFTK